jgi:fatty acid desaturase
LLSSVFVDWFLALENSAETAVGDCRSIMNLVGI